MRQVTLQLEQVSARGALLESAAAAIVIINEEGCIVLVNKGAEDMFGYSRQEMTGQPLEILLPKAQPGENLLRLGLEPVSAEFFKPLVNVIVNILRVQGIKGMIRNLGQSILTAYWDYTLRQRVRY